MPPREREALLSCLRKGNVFIKFYDQINMEIFADDIPDKTKHAYIHKIFSDYSEQELQEAIHTLEVFFEHDGSIARAAAALISSIKIRSSFTCARSRSARDTIPALCATAPCFISSSTFIRIFICSSNRCK